MNLVIPCFEFDHVEVDCGRTSSFGDRELRLRFAQTNTQDSFEVAVRLVLQDPQQCGTRSMAEIRREIAEFAALKKRLREDFEGVTGLLQGISAVTGALRFTVKSPETMTVQAPIAFDGYQMDQVVIVQSERWNGCEDRFAGGRAFHTYIFDSKEFT